MDAVAEINIIAQTLRMTAVATNDGCGSRGNKRRPLQQATAVATNDTVCISRSRSNS
jgi:hypothetical protein